jgi:hypothetical protein
MCGVLAPIIGIVFAVRLALSWRNTSVFTTFDNCIAKPAIATQPPIASPAS